MSIRNRSISSVDIWSRPDVLETTMFMVVGDFNSPGHRISGDGKPIALRLVFDRRNAKLFRFPGFNLHR